MQRYFQDYLGISHVIWLKHGILGDHTDGHIDNLARFVGPRTVMCAFTENSRDKNYSALKANYDALRRSRDQDGKPLEIVKLPMPHVKPGSYANFYIANEVVLVPAFGHANDEIARRIIQQAFPDREAIGVDCSDIICGGGTLHCITQQQPFSVKL